MNALSYLSSRRLVAHRVLSLSLGLATAPWACAATNIESAISISDDRDVIGAGDTTVYEIIVSNAGPGVVHQATVHVSVSGYVAQATWTCETDTGAPCAVAEGIGAPVELIDIPVDHALIYHLGVTTKSNASSALTVFGTLRLHGDQFELDDADNTAIDVDDFGVFANGFDNSP
jgi:hypothetical protein